ncbi:MAG: cbb3-type cytochrome c oxidase subunit 3 [Hyphomicrobiales bacterium]|uniref:cbb3-type cytochrome c oxidase subunit 3 n=1 Tax=Rhabdaerophilum calidifontis TaxID=2604328 RepID=UPI00123A74BE|nr:cbb3-type cytochrome c oxidase subunit 3 [Rhabdaerophilum calidifontis]MCA1953128.1 cbb3-type cytochrome c oxidase subunit 3 [Hyphomicrobiales bacterium]MCA1999300.1 cbb3-type cytochrome c oxidase subunit 3 [Hyphomicrobiales bacterium]
MTQTYALLAGIAQQFGVLFFMAIFLSIVAYALWPKNRARFDAAAEIPLKED